MKLHFVLPKDKYSSRDHREEVCVAIKRLSHEIAYTVDITEWSSPLPDNLRARVHIAIRDLANFCGYSESQMKYAIVKESYYPKTLKKWRDEMKEVPVDTMKLTPDQARAVEYQLHALAAEIGCPMSQPENWE